MSSATLTPGATFGPFEVRGQLGHGGMGVVYRAFDHRHGGEVALKLLPAALASDATFLERFRREARAAFELSDPHIVPVHDYGEIDGRLYLSMQLVHGRDLSKILQSGPLDPRRAVSIVRQAAHALDAAHTANLIHRDVKPANLLVVEHRDDFTYLVDFGIAHLVGRSTVATSLTSTGATIGTLAYMAPERFGTNPIDGRVDVYSLACVLFEMLTGSMPFSTSDPHGLIGAHLNAPPPKVTDTQPAQSPAWNALIARGMAKSPDDRYATPHELADDARRVLEGQAPAPVTAVRTRKAAPLPPTFVPPGPSPWPAHRAHPHPPAPGPSRSSIAGWVVAAVCACLVLALSAAVLVLSGATGSGAPPDPTRGPTTAPPTASGSPTGPATPTAPATGASPVRTGDLGLSVPLTTVPCDGRYAVFVGAAIDPARYRTDMATILARHPGASYLLSEQNCSSLRQRMPNGASIYTAYYGPYDTLADACVTKSRAGSDAFVRRLDNTTPVGSEPAC